MTKPEVGLWWCAGDNHYCKPQLLGELWLQTILLSLSLSLSYLRVIRFCTYIIYNFLVKNVCAAWWIVNLVPACDHYEMNNWFLIRHLLSEWSVLNGTFSRSSECWHDCAVCVTVYGTGTGKGALKGALISNFRSKTKEGIWNIYEYASTWFSIYMHSFFFFSFFLFFFFLTE